MSPFDIRNKFDAQEIIDMTPSESFTVERNFTEAIADLSVNSY